MFSRETLAKLTKFPYKHFSTFEFESEVNAHAQTAIFQTIHDLLTKFQILTHLKATFNNL